ncbi:MAG: thiamine pyrophosphate-dependent enzyme [bacterium]
MMANIKTLSAKPEQLTGGHRMCPGCGAPIIVRQTLMAIDEPVIVVAATGCLEVSTTIFPFTAWKVPFLHSAFENAAATASGIEAAYQSLKRQGKITKNIKIVAFGGDGGTYDIGFQALSGAMERFHNMLYICYNNEAYMNTGVQRSSATPKGANTTTEPAGKVGQGKNQMRKDLTYCMVAHNIPFVAQASLAYWNDYVTEVQKAMATEGPSFINVLSPCQLGWQCDPSKTVEISRQAVENCFWPVYEVSDRKWKLNVKPKEKKPIIEYLKAQGRFRHLFKPGNEALLTQIQAEVDRNWEELLARCGEKEEVLAK